MYGLEVDVTARIAPLFNLLDCASREIIKQACELVMARFTLSYPWITRLLRGSLRPGIDKYERKHFSGQQR